MYVQYFNLALFYLVIHAMGGQRPLSQQWFMELEKEKRKQFKDPGGNVMVFVIRRIIHCLNPGAVEAYS